RPVVVFGRGQFQGRGRGIADDALGTVLHRYDEGVPAIAPLHAGGDCKGHRDIVGGRARGNDGRARAVVLTDLAKAAKGERVGVAGGRYLVRRDGGGLATREGGHGREAVIEEHARVDVRGDVTGAIVRVENRRQSS